MAAHYWQAAQSVALELNCHCTIVAGEFYEYPEQELPYYSGDYRKALLEYDPQAWKSEHKHATPDRNAWKKHKIPGTWGFHDYKDVVEARSTNASEFQHFTSGGKLGKPRVWISEAGVQLHNGAEGKPPTRLATPPEANEFNLQTEAANAFTSLRYAKPIHGNSIPRIERVYYYEYEAPREATLKIEPNAFDSGLVEAEPEPGGEGKSYGEVRPVYCFLAYESHRCPPTVVTLSERSAKVDTHGIEAEVSFEWELTGSNEIHTVNAQARGADVFRPQVIPANSVFARCTSYRYRAMVKNHFGETATGQYINVSQICT